MLEIAILSGVARFVIGAIEIERKSDRLRELPLPRPVPISPFPPYFPRQPRSLAKRTSYCGDSAPSSGTVTIFGSTSLGWIDVICVCCTT